MRLPVACVFNCSRPGGHADNEDAFAVRALPGSSDSYLCALADGQGGRAGGGAAARLACNVCLEAAAAQTQMRLLLPMTWLAIFAEADRAVAGDSTAGLTTLVAFCIANGHICGASNGDSAALAQVANGAPVILTNGQLKNPPVGSGDAAVVPFGIELSSPWRVLAMADGVWKYAGWENILKIIREQPSEDVISLLAERARMRSGGFQDDFTAVLLSVGDEKRSTA